MINLRSEVTDYLASRPAPTRDLLEKIYNDPQAQPYTEMRKKNGAQESKLYNFGVSILCPIVFGAVLVVPFLFGVWAWAAAVVSIKEQIGNPSLVFHRQFSSAAPVLGGILWGVVGLALVGLALLAAGYFLSRKHRKEEVPLLTDYLLQGLQDVPEAAPRDSVESDPGSPQQLEELSEAQKAEQRIEKITNPLTANFLRSLTAQRALEVLAELDRTELALSATSSHVDDSPSQDECDAAAVALHTA